MTNGPKEKLFMTEAIAQARKAAALGEVPVGCVVVHSGVVVAGAHNEVESTSNPCAHAEILAMGRAGAHLGAWRLENASVFVTLEPCTMCIGAMILARVKRLYFGARDQRMGAVGSLYDLSNHSELPHRIEVISGLCDKECQAILREFFRRS